MIRWLKSINHKKIQLDMINAQEYWNKKVYKEQLNNLHYYSTTTEIASGDVKKYNELLLDNPVMIAKFCIPTSDEELLNSMINLSKNPLLHMVRRISLNSFYPIEEKTVKFEHHEVDKMLGEQIDRILKDSGYKLLNKIDSKSFVSYYHKELERRANINSSFIENDDKIYDYINKHTDLELLPFVKDKIMLGHITQLFPVLEYIIRELGKFFWVFPFKEKADEFMKYKDPSSILREILALVFEETGSFENVPDLLFVYHYMYNSYSLNVRNECIHGRDYTEGDRLKLGFKITLLSIYMIMFRIRIIEERLSDDNNTN